MYFQTISANTRLLSKRCDENLNHENIETALQLGSAEKTVYVIFHAHESALLFEAPPSSRKLTISKLETFSNQVFKCIQFIIFKSVGPPFLKIFFYRTISTILFCSLVVRNTAVEYIDQS